MSVEYTVSVCRKVLRWTGTTGGEARTGSDLAKEFDVHMWSDAHFARTRSHTSFLRRASRGPVADRGNTSAIVIRNRRPA